MRKKPLFLKWLLLQAVAILSIAAIGAAYGGRIHGISLAAIPIILATFTWATFLGGRACWWLGKNKDRTALREAQYLNFWGWVCQIEGILCTIFGFWVILTQGTDTEALGERIQNGGSVALAGTFVGVFCSMILAMEERMIEHEASR